MIPITKVELRRLIAEAEEKGIEVSHLERKLNDKTIPENLSQVKLNFQHSKKIGKKHYISTGPINVKDFA